MTLKNPLLRAVVVALTGAVAGVVCLVSAYTWRPALTIEMDQELPRRIAAGVYPPERAEIGTFAWTGRRADFTLPGADRRTPWTCSIRFRGGRADPRLQPRVDASVDGLTGASAAATNEFQDLTVPAPAGARDGLTLTIVSSMTVSPGGSDPRELGIQIDRLECRPAGAAIFLPPRSAIRNAAIAAGIFGLAFALAGLSLPVALAAAVLFAAAQALPLSAGIAPYSGFSRTMLPIAAWIGGVLVACTRIPGMWGRQPISSAARFVMVFSAAALYLKLGGLLHPAKPLVDAVFHAHRFEWVLAGRYYFTQGMPGGVSFPYAIGLYLFAAPWSALTRDYVTLLRIVVCASEVVAGALLYPLIVKTWSDRLMAAVAVALFNVVPLPYGLVGNANLTNAFGQSAALVTLIAAAAWGLAWRRPWPVAGVFGLAALAFLSHVSTFSLLAVTLLAFAVCCWRLPDASSRAAARVVVGVTIAAALFAVATYYGHFLDVYETAWRARTTSHAVVTPAAPPAAATGTTTPAMGTPLPTRLENALGLTLSSVGWPILVLGVGGCWRIVADRRRDRLICLLAAWGAAYVVFVVFALMRVDVPFQRYAAEFVGRVVFATYPAAVVTAAAGAAWAWRAGQAPRALSAAFVLCALAIGLRTWFGWFT